MQKERGRLKKWFQTAFSINIVIEHFSDFLHILQ